ncbi:SET domain-containing protein 9-like [Paramacrobiotus metropolitanus]|uniref:SET domain-containing protein 9-like n=1 Tax=Paramacrobiotus metropolitanus TaxID=2943436 RepID=UPI002446312A|nr:SET domain-containing protein 9-like [Paramacrobiotus metropolitanus]
MWRNVAEWWSSYKYRFVPWIAFYLRNRAIKLEKTAVPPAELQATVAELAKYLDTTVRTERRDPFAPLAKRIKEISSTTLSEVMGFTLRVRKSRIPKAGRGVFVESGVVQPDTLVALYPGTVYDAGEPVLLQSFGNPYIIQCGDGSFIDGKPGGISRLIYRSCANRDQFHGYRFCDSSWMDRKDMMNPYAVGQYVNNERPPEFVANVAYHEFDLPPEFDLVYRKYIPNVHFSPEKDRPLRMIGLVSLRSIQMGEELYSSYFASYR